MFHVHYLETEFLQTVWKLTERISSLGTTIELFHFIFRRCTFMNCSSQTRNSPCLLSIFISFRAYDAPRPFWNLHRVLRLPLHVPVYFLCNPFRGLSMLSRNMEANRSLRSLIFTVFRVYVLFRIFTKLRLCLRIWWI